MTLSTATIINTTAIATDSLAETATSDIEQLEIVQEVPQVENHTDNENNVVHEMTTHYANADGGTACLSAAILSKMQKKRRVPCYGKVQQRNDREHKERPSNDVSVNEAFLLQGETEDKEEELPLQFSQESLAMVNDATQSQTLTVQETKEAHNVPLSSEEEVIDDQDILSSVDTLFMEADIQTFTVKDIISSVQDLFQTTLKKDKRKLIRERLIELVNQVQEQQEEQLHKDDSHDEDNDDDHDDDEKNKQNDDTDQSDSNSKDASESFTHRKTKKTTQKRKSVKKRSRHVDSSTPQRMSRPKRTPAKKRIPSHVKIHHESLRKRQLAEAQVLAEEMQEKVQQRISEEDKKRAEAIAKKFETDTEELRIKREKERKELIELLEEKRMQLLSYNDKEQVEYNGNNDHMVSISCENDQRSCSSSGSSVGRNGERSSDEEESDEEEELEIVGLDSKDPLLVPGVSGAKLPLKPPAPQRRLSPTSVTASCLMSSKKNDTNRNSSNTATISKPKVIGDPRKLLRNKLKAKQVEYGNMWLARELGYENVEDHLRDCNLEETGKIKEIIALEKQRLYKLKMTDGVEHGNSHSNLNPLNEVISKELQDDHTDRTRLNLNDMSEPEVEAEEDEEMAMAKEVENEMNENMDDDESYIFDTTQGVQGGFDNGHDDDVSANVSHQADLDMNADNEAEDVSPDTTPLKNRENVKNFHSGVKTVGSSDETKLSNGENSTADAPSSRHEVNKEENVESVDKADNATKSKPRNTLWKEVLRKEAELYKKMKTRKGGFVENEAEEEEEEEGVAGLEDFGFVVPSKKKSDDDDEEENADAQDDDFENIVDDVSDDEGDEEAGEAARKAMAIEEEKLRHKEIIRTMRDGYDGRRGGIATIAGTARGNLAFDQLVAADNKNGAKNLGLSNEDEFDNEDDDNAEATEDGEIEDEADLIDKILKDRYLNRTNVPAEEFSDSDDDEESIHNEDNEDEPEDEEDVEQELLAKRFARRARMNRLIEIYGADEEFSQGRLLDQSEEMQKELRSIRNVPVGARRQTSFASSATSTGDSSSQLLDNPISSLSGSNLGASECSLFASASSLSFSNGRNRNTSKRKSSFLTMCRQSTKKKMARPSGVALGHVVFAGDHQSSNLSKSAILSSIKSLSTSAPREKASKASASATRSSLWSKVASNGFKSKSTM